MFIPSPPGLKFKLKLKVKVKADELQWMVKTTIQVDIIQMDDNPADSCAISPMAFLF